MMPAILITISILLRQDRRDPRSPPTRLVESCPAPSRTHGTGCPGMNRQNRNRNVRARARQLLAVTMTMAAMLVCRSMWCRTPVDKATAFALPAKGDGSVEVHGDEIYRRWGRDPLESVGIVLGTHSSLLRSYPIQYRFLELHLIISTLHQLGDACSKKQTTCRDGAATVEARNGPHPSTRILK